MPTAGEATEWRFLLSPESGLGWAGKLVARLRALEQAEGGDGAALGLGPVLNSCYTLITHVVEVFIKANEVGWKALPAQSFTDVQSGNRGGSPDGDCGHPLPAIQDPSIMPVLPGLFGNLMGTVYLVFCLVHYDSPHKFIPYIIFMMFSLALSQSQTKF